MLYSISNRTNDEFYFLVVFYVSLLSVNPRADDPNQTLARRIYEGSNKVFKECDGTFWTEDRVVMWPRCDIYDVVAR